MTASHPRHRRALAIPAGIAMATALAFLPNTAATAAPADTAPAAAPADATPLSYVVDVRGGHGTSAHVKKAIGKDAEAIELSVEELEERIAPARLR